MNKFLTVFVFFIASNCFSQEWNIDFETAKSLAHAKNKHVFLVFSGSDWCTPCMKLEKEVFQTAEFLDYAEDNLILIRADFPKKKKNALDDKLKLQNDKLAEIYNTEGFFPLIVILDNKGKVKGKVSYEKISVEEYIKLFEDFVK